nr:MAG TPA: hypothetical protein [Caudoviricetes sp.]
MHAADPVRSAQELLRLRNIPPKSSKPHRPSGRRAFDKNLLVCFRDRHPDNISPDRWKRPPQGGLFLSCGGNTGGAEVLWRRMQRRWRKCLLRKRQFVSPKEKTAHR